MNSAFGSNLISTKLESFTISSFNVSKSYKSKVFLLFLFNVNIKPSIFGKPLVFTFSKVATSNSPEGLPW